MAIGARCAALLALATACAGPPPPDTPSEDVAVQAPSEEPSIRGVITATDEGSILVEETPAEESGSAKARVRLGPRTVIRFASGEPGAQADLKQGVSVAVWFDGPVAESYPVQAMGGTIRIEGGTPFE